MHNFQDIDQRKNRHSAIFLFISAKCVLGYSCLISYILFFADCSAISHYFYNTEI